MGCRAADRVGVDRWKACSCIKMLIDYLVTVFHNLSAVGSREEVLLFSMYFTVSQNVLEFVLQDTNFCLKI